MKYKWVIKIKGKEKVEYNSTDCSIVRSANWIEVVYTFESKPEVRRFLWFKYTVNKDSIKQTFLLVPNEQVEYVQLLEDKEQKV